MKKSDLPWVLPLLSAVAADKIIQFRSEKTNVWCDWSDINPQGILPSFSGDADNYRIKPELKTPFQVYVDAAYPNHKDMWGPSLFVDVTRGINTVLRAYKAGELDLTGME